MTAADTGAWHRVRVDHTGQPARDEQVRGHSMDEAMANAEHQWPRDRITYLGADEPLQDDDLTAAIDDLEDAADDTPDWWGDDYPGDGDAGDDADEAAA